MDTYFEREYYLRVSDFDYRGKLHASSILDLFQDVAGLHADLLGCGHDEIIVKKMIWVLVRVKFEVLSDVDMYQKVIVKTWPLAPSRAGFKREYLIEDENGKVIVKGSSDWVIMHSEKRKLMPAKDIYPTDFEFRTERACEEKIPKIHDFEPNEETKTITPTFLDIDLNRHVNNTKYANFVVNSVNLAEDEFIKTMQIDYRHEVRSDAPLQICTARNDGEILAKGINQEEETMFACKITLDSRK